MVARASGGQLQDIVALLDSACGALRERDHNAADKALKIAATRLVGCAASPVSILALWAERQVIADRLDLSLTRGLPVRAETGLVTLRWIDRLGGGANVLPERLALHLAEFLADAGRDAALRNRFAALKQVRAAHTNIAASLGKEADDKLSRVLDEAEEDFDFTEDGKLTLKGRRRLLDQLAKPLLDWQLPPLFPGDWQDADAEEAAQIVAGLGARFGRDFDPVGNRIHRVRSLQLRNWGGQAWLLEMQGVDDTGAPAQIDVIQFADRSIMARENDAETGASGQLDTCLPGKLDGLAGYLELARLQLALKPGEKVYRLLSDRGEPTPPFEENLSMPEADHPVCAAPEVMEEGSMVHLRAMGFGNAACMRARCIIDDQGRLLSGPHPDLLGSRKTLSERAEIRTGVFRRLKTTPQIVAGGN